MNEMSFLLLSNSYWWVFSLGPISVQYSNSSAFPHAETCFSGPLAAPNGSQNNVRFYSLYSFLFISFLLNLNEFCPKFLRYFLIVDAISKCCSDWILFMPLLCFLEVFEDSILVFLNYHLIGLVFNLYPNSIELLTCSTGSAIKTLPDSSCSASRNGSGSGSFASWSLWGTYIREREAIPCYYET